MTLAKALKVTLMYVKNNLTQDVIAELCGVSQPTISRVITELEAPIAAVLDEFVPDPTTTGAGRVLVVDGSLHPCWSWQDHRQLYSGKHHTSGHNHQYVVDLTGTLVHLADPVPGSVHDAKAVRDTGVLEVIDPANTIADKGYIGTGILTPYRKPPGGELLDWQKKFNTDINKLRYVVERAIANVKTWRILLTDYRRPLHTYPTTFTMIRALVFFKQGF
jgi:DDE superfamily endonuclease/Helix-turn-helix of DDE superfamily endonuclease